MSHKRPLPSPARVEAYAASALHMLLWLLGLVLRAGFTGRSARFKALLSFAEACVERILFLKAVASYGPPPKRRHHPRSFLQGFRRVERLRAPLFYKGARIRARKSAALARISALIHALTHPERAVAYFFKRICKGLRLGRLIIVSPAAETLSGGAFVAAIAVCDSS
jgi:hypothetical protein